MNPFQSKWLSAAGLLLVITIPAQAQPNFHSEMSVEAMVLNSDAVVLGKIVEVIGGKGFHEATIAVEETLRGEHRARQRVRFPDRIWQLGVGGYGADDLFKLKGESPRLLVVMRGKPAQVSGLIFLTEQDMRTGGAGATRKADLTKVERPADVLRIAKETLRRSPGVKRIDTFPLTVPIQGGYYFGRGGHTTVAVPVDVSLEMKALEYIRSKERWQRTEGAAALKHFKSDENIARLTMLLSDADPYIAKDAASNLGIEVRIHTVRRTAFESLQYWGVIVKAPVFEEEMANFDAVRRVDLMGDSFKPAALKGLGRFKNMQELNLDSSGLTDEDAKELSRYKNLQNLNLYNTKVTDATLKQLAQFKDLRSLHLGSSKITDVGIKQLASLAKLQSLFLSGTQLTNEGLKDLVSLKNLAELSVSDTRVTDAGLKELAGFTKLTTVYLSGNQVTDHTLQMLRQQDRLHVLERATAQRRPGQPGYENSPRAKSALEVVTLDLSRTKVTDAGLDELAVLVNLERLYLEDTKTTQAGVARLRKTLPKCNISR